MTKKELIENIAGQTGLSHAEASIAVEAFMSCVTEAVDGGEKVILRGFGSFYRETKKPRKVRDFKTGNVYERPSASKIAFKSYAETIYE